MSRAESYARMFDKAGRRVTLERPIANQPAMKVSDVRARIMEAKPDEVASGVASTQRKILILAADIPQSARPLRKGDQILVDGLRLTFTDRPDDQTHRDGEALLAVAGMVTGA